MSATLYAYEALRQIVGRAIYEVDEEIGNATRPDWYSLSMERREPWMRDADRVLRAISQLPPEHPELAPLGIRLDAEPLAEARNRPTAVRYAGGKPR